MALVAAACGGGAGSATTVAPPTSAAGGVSTTASTAVPGRLDGFAGIEVMIGGEVWPVALADTPALRSRGLMGVTDLGDARGMLFTWDADVVSGFWMKGTLIPLDVAFFGADGALVDLLSMAPCLEDPCPSYRPSGPYRSALEVPAGGFEGLDTIDLQFP